MDARPAPLRLLHLEDSEADHALAVAHLRRAGLDFACERVDTRQGFDAALAAGWDAILSDYNLPGFTGLDALRRVRERGLALPFILVSGEIGEDTAVEAMRHGASDYLLKGNLARLAPALEHAIEAARERRERLEAEHELERSREQLRGLARHLQASIDSERAAIAREIHDDVGGALTALSFDLHWLRGRVADAEQRARIETAQETLAHAIEASKRIMHNLRPAILEQGLLPALQWMVANFAKRTGIDARLHAVEPLPSLPAGVPLVAYRTAQEALTNVAKHAQATRVDVELQAGAGVLSLEISDNGRGLAAGDLEKARSFGLRGLHERASTVGGWVDLSSGRGGTTLILSVPLVPGAGDPCDNEAEPGAAPA
ncbi:MAG: histidine kinase [Rubrivivax sp.]|nr:histidine kinase [Rubrivivax sp.]